MGKFKSVFYCALFILLICQSIVLQIIHLNVVFFEGDVLTIGGSDRGQVWSEAAPKTPRARRATPHVKKLLLARQMAGAGSPDLSQPGEPADQGPSA